MKEHLNVNRIANPTGWMDNHKARESREHHDIPRRETLSDTLLTDTDDLFSGTVPLTEFDESSIEGMDFNAALESLNFIREQAGTVQGRRMMGQAHRQISPQKVMELFG